MADKPVAEVVNVDAVIDALSPSPTSSDVYEATLPFNPHAVAASAVRRADEGGGASFPAEWTVGANGELEIETGVGGVALRLVPTGDQAGSVFELLDESGAVILRLGGDPTNGRQTALTVIGRGGTSGSVPLNVKDADGAALFNVDADGVAAHYSTADPSDTSANVLTIGVSALANEFAGGPLRTVGPDQFTQTFYVATNGEVYTRKGVIIDGNDPIVPDDWIGAGQAAVWFDATNGAAKLKIRGRTLDGTYASGEVALA